MSHPSTFACTAISVVVLGTLLGCGGRPPVTPQGSASLDELKATLVESLAAGDYDRIWACVYPKGDEFAKDRDYRNSMEAMYAWGRNLKLSLRCVRVLDPKEFSIPPEAMYIDGRAIEPNFEPSHLLSIHYWNPPTERDPSGLGAATFHLDVSVGQVDGKWWCVGMKQADPKKQPSQSIAESVEPLAPLGEELSKAEGVSLKRAEGPFAELGFNSLFVKSEDAKEMTKSPRGAHLLGDLLLDVMPFDHWTKDFHLLPEGYYTLSVENLPKTREQCFDIVCEALEGSFDLKIEVGETSWDAFRISVPDELPQDVWADADAEWSMNGGPSASTGAVDSYQLKGITFAEFEEWLSDHLNGPVTIVNPPEGKYSMDVLIGGVDEAKLLEIWLKEGGFGVEHYQTPVPTVTVSPADKSTQAE
ncbi:hypothetical protein [Aeoliella sp. SH292]|uniref:hypothetical protein n=1 Tax=Aeoliella sp. SH292 TaxID=3454464 RepID=UPI003F9DCE43